MKTSIKVFLVIIVGIILVALLLVVFWNFIGNSDSNGYVQNPYNVVEYTPAPGNAADAQRFKERYEELNYVLNDYGDSQHRHIYIPENNRVVFIDFDELMELIDSGTGVFFFGRPGCPSCRALFPTLLEVAEVEGMYIYYYYYIDSDRSEHNENYARILELLHEYLPTDLTNQTPDEEGFDENQKRVTLPHLFFMQDGVVVNEIMMNRHPLLLDEDYAGLYGFLLELFRSIQPYLDVLPCDDC
jgi:thiol-disulfide isomerase/thioredoxin